MYLEVPLDVSGGRAAPSKEASCFPRVDPRDVVRFGCDTREATKEDDNVDLLPGVVFTLTGKTPTVDLRCNSRFLCCMLEFWRSARL